MRFVLAVLMLYAVPTAVAQTAFFLEGQGVMSVSGFFQSVEDVEGGGLQLSTTVLPHLEAFTGLAWTASDMSDDEPSVWLLGVAYYPERQGINGPLTLGMSLSVGSTNARGQFGSPERVPVVGFGIEAARAFEPLGRTVLIVPTGSVVLNQVFSYEASFSPTPTFGASVAIGLRAFDRAVVFVSPGVTATMGNETAIGFLGSFGVSLGY